jgi:flagellar basal body-associated protein FliL
MTNKIKELVQFAALAAPAYALEINLEPTGFGKELTTLTIPGIVQGAISLVMLVVALVFFFILIMGGLRWVMSEGDQKAVEGARAQITNALIGLAIVFAAFAIMRLIEAVFGVSLFKLAIPSFQ